MDIWVGSKICAVEKALVGDELLGMTNVQYPGHTIDNLVPVSPKIDHQLDTVVIDWMSDRGAKLMQEFSRKLVRKKAHWFEIYLAMFIMLNNIEYVYGQQKVFCADFLDGVSKPSPMLHYT